ncbi:MAG: DUF418 domain-containing protein [Bacteroidota bacterium]
MKTQPTQLSERIVSLDVLRGFAILGILVMNIQYFSMISAAYLNPVAYGDFNGANKWVWMLSHIFTDMKFWSIFSMLFGAGIVLFTERLKSKGIKSLAIHYRRTFWLLLIGLAHAYLLWSGDILVPYSITALWVVLFRKKKPVNLFIVGIVFFSIASFLYMFSGFSMPFWPEESKTEILQMWLPDIAHINEELAAFQGSWSEQMPKRIETTLMMQTRSFFFMTAWRTAGIMLIGMAFYKWGILSALKSKSFYLKLALFTLIPGFVIIIYGMNRNFDAGFSLEYTFFLGSQFNYWGSLLVSTGYIALVMLCMKMDILKTIKKSLQAVGQMAFTNYMLQTIICTTIFYGHGFGLFGKIERTSQILIVFAVWIFQMIVSPIWMKYFKYGPFEWLWRSLTYWNFQSFKR